MSFRAEFRAHNETGFYGNAMVFATEKEAKIYGRDKFMSWWGADDWRVVETDMPVTYALVQDEEQENAYHLVWVEETKPIITEDED